MFPIFGYDFSAFTTFFPSDFARFSFWFCVTIAGKFSSLERHFFARNHHLFSLRKICTLCKKFVAIYKQKKFWLQIFSLFKLLSHHQIPPGRVYNTLHSLATWIERTGEKVYNRLLERPAQMLGCKFFNRRPMPTFWTYFCFTISAISAQFSMFCLYRLTFSALANQIRPSLRRFCICCHTVALCVSSFHCLCHSRELTFDIAQRIHRINRAYFRWSHA